MCDSQARAPCYFGPDTAVIIPSLTRVFGDAHGAQLPSRFVKQGSGAVGAALESTIATIALLQSSLPFARRVRKIIICFVGRPFATKVSARVAAPQGGQAFALLQMGSPT